MSTVAYMRVSSEEQKQRQTITTQHEQIERYSLKHEIAVADFYADDGISGTIPIDQRPEGRRLIADARAGKLKRLLVYKLDRLGRDALVTLSAIDALDQCGVEIVSITQNLDLKTPHGKFMAVIDCGVSGYERDTIVERSVDGQRRVAEAGGWLGGKPPFGYRLSGVGSAGRLVPSETHIPHIGMSEAEVVREMYRLVVEERRTCQYVADWLNGLGVPTVYAREGVAVKGEAARGVWSVARVRNVLTSTTYKGLQIYGKRSARGAMPVERECAALVLPARWQAAQEALIERRTYASRNAFRDYLFRGLIVCGQCGCHYHGLHKHDKRGGKGWTYYTCNSKGLARANGEERRACAAVNGDELEAQVFAKLGEWSRNPQAFADLAWAQISAETDGLVDLDAEIKRRRRAAADLKRERDAILTLYRKGRISEADLDKQFDGIDAEERQHEEEVARLRSLAAERDEQIARIHAVERILGQLFTFLDDADTFAKRRAIIERCLSRVVVRTVEGRAVADIKYQLDDLDPSIITRTGTRAYSNRATVTAILGRAA